MNLLVATSRWHFASLTLLAFVFIAAGVNHFVSPQVYLKIMPGYLLWPMALIYVSGFFEILGGVGVAVPKLRRAAGWGLIALLVAVFPANVDMWMRADEFPSLPPLGVVVAASASRRANGLGLVGDDQNHDKAKRGSMSDLMQLMIVMTLVGLAIPFGGAIAMVERISPRWLERELRHSVIAFGGGVLIAAVALVLVPEGVKELSLTWIITAFVTGAIAFWGMETCLARSKHSRGQVMAMLSDFVPESIALGTAFAHGEGAGILFSVLIGLQNLPEGFNAFRELRSTTSASNLKLLLWLTACVPLGPLVGLVGYMYLADSPSVVGFIMLFSASGILYLMFQDLAPQAKSKDQRAPAIGAVFGFLLGVIGKVLLDG